MKVPWSKHDWHRVLVYGLGSSGRSAARLLLEQGVDVVAVDRRPPGQIELGELGACESLELASGAEPISLPPGVDGVVVSPGVPSERPLLVEARSRGVPVVSEVELASLFVSGPIIGITGSNGKSTTTALTGALLKHAGVAVEVCGNIGRPLSSCVQGARDRVFVVELSSFQLETVQTLRPRISVFLNLSPDHLDRHGSEESYLAAKANIFANQEADDVAILNADDPMVMRTAIRARRRCFSRLRTVEDGCYLDGDVVVEKRPDGRARALFECRELSLEGLHNLENAMAATLTAASLGVEIDGFARVLAEFEGLPHRMQRIAEIDGVEWFDDSKGTNVGAVVKSLAGMCGKSVHLILGGYGKGADFSALAGEVGRAVRRVYLIGEAAVDLERALKPAAPMELCNDLQTAVEAAARNARRGETVLLSPACASFDQYRSYSERGEHFLRLVRELKEVGNG